LINIKKEKIMELVLLVIVLALLAASIIIHMRKDVNKKEEPVTQEPETPVQTTIAQVPEEIKPAEPEVKPAVDNTINVSEMVKSATKSKPKKVAETTGKTVEVKPKRKSGSRKKSEKI
jgi:hypothetical protein